MHPFYPQYLKQFYESRKDLDKQPYAFQSQALAQDSFSAIHMLAPHLHADPRFLYNAELVVANCHQAQARWLVENNIKPGPQTSFADVLRWQIEAFEPDIIYLTDPVTFDANSVRSLHKRPALVLGWRAANIPNQTDWSEFDCLLSSLKGIRDPAAQLGAKHTAHFTPRFPERIAAEVAGFEPSVDVVFRASTRLANIKAAICCSMIFRRRAKIFRIVSALNLICPANRS